MIRVLFFAKLREDLGVRQLEMTPEGIATIHDLVLAAASKLGGDSLQQLSSPQLVISRNHEVTGRDAAVADGDEIAFYPPVTGG
jgi:molybdopterin synthase sulfur carrier subunit